MIDVESKINLEVELSRSQFFFEFVRNLFCVHSHIQDILRRARDIEEGAELRGGV